MKHKSVFLKHFSWSLWWSGYSLFCVTICFPRRIGGFHHLVCIWFRGWHVHWRFFFRSKDFFHLPVSRWTIVTGRTIRLSFLDWVSVFLFSLRKIFLILFTRWRITSNFFQKRPVNALEEIIIINIRFLAVGTSLAFFAHLSLPFLQTQFPFFFSEDVGENHEQWQTKRTGDKWYNEYVFLYECVKKIYNQLN